MKASKAFAFGILLCVSTFIAQADEIILKSGGSVCGEVVSRDDVHVVFKTAYGSVTFETSEILDIKYSSTVEKEIRDKMRILPPSDTRDRLKLASRASAAGLRDLSRSIYTQVVAINPDDKAARQALGYVFYETEWVTAREKNLHPGLVPYQGRWVTIEERETLKKGEEDRRYLASFDLTPAEGTDILKTMSDIDLAIEPRGGYVVRRHVKSLPVKDKPYVYSVDILNWRRLGVFIGITFLDGSRKRMPGFGELEFTVYETEADALGNRKLGKVVIAEKITVKPDMWDKKSDFKYWDTKINTGYEEIVSDQARKAWSAEYFMNYDGILYVLANRDVNALTPPGVFYVEAMFICKDKQKKVGRFVQYAQLR